MTLGIAGNFRTSGWRDSAHQPVTVPVTARRTAGRDPLDAFRSCSSSVAHRQ
jgi:hypothetical protein